MLSFLRSDRELQQIRNKRRYLVADNKTQTQIQTAGLKDKWLVTAMTSMIPSDARNGGR